MKIHDYYTLQVAVDIQLMNEQYIGISPHLSEYVSRAGDLAGASYNSVSSIDGTRLHQRIFDDLKSSTVMI